MQRAEDYGLLGPRRQPQPPLEADTTVTSALDGTGSDDAAPIPRRRRSTARPKPAPLVRDVGAPLERRPAESTRPAGHDAIRLRRALRELRDTPDAELRRELRRDPAQAIRAVRHLDNLIARIGPTRC